MEAIRLLRQQRSMGLAEAKAAVESAEHPAAKTPVEYGWELPREAKTALDQGKLLQVDDAPSAPARPGARNPSGLAPGEVPRAGFSASLVIVVLLIVAAGFWLLRRG